MEITPYNQDFFKDQRDGSLRSARKIVPLIMEIVHPESVVDVGCGLGTWLKVFNEHKVKDILGIDGEYVDRRNLMIAESNFLSHDLSKPLAIDRKQFELAISLEVVEHIEKKYAKIFIENLINLSDVIVFSAAVPRQGGTHHVNERWPQFWEKIFKDFGYELLDPFRMKIINMDNVEWWYKQNIFLAVKRELLNDDKYRQLPKFNKDFYLMHEVVFRRNILSRGIKNFINKYIFCNMND